MANKKVFKWLVGMSSVAMFTGFVGLSQKYDQNNTTANVGNSTNNAQFNQDSENIFPNDDTSVDDGTQSSWGQDGQGFQDSNSFGNNSSDNHIRSRAS